MRVAHEGLIHDLRRRADEERARRIEPLSVGTIAYFLGPRPRCKRSRVERRRRGQASMPSCQRTPNAHSLARVVDLHTFDKKREGGKEGGRDPLTQLLKSPGRSRRTGRRSSSCGCGRPSSNAMRPTAAVAGHKKSVKRRKSSSSSSTRMRRNARLTAGMEFHHAKGRRTRQGGEVRRWSRGVDTTAAQVNVRIRKAEKASIL